jgi:hypothetical protein
MLLLLIRWAIGVQILISNDNLGKPKNKFIIYNGCIYSKLSHNLEIFQNKYNKNSSDDSGA